MQTEYCQLVVIIALLTIGGRVLAEQQQIQEENPTGKKPYFQEIYHHVKY